MPLGAVTATFPDYPERMLHSGKSGEDYEKTMLIAALVAGMGMSIGAFAQVPASAPAGTTGLCKDGSFYSGASKKEHARAIRV